MSAWGLHLHGRYVQLCAEDYMWWWRSYYRGASIGLYVLLYSSEWPPKLHAALVCPPLQLLPSPGSVLPACCVRVTGAMAADPCCPWPGPPMCSRVPGEHVEQPDGRAAHHPVRVLHGPGGVVPHAGHGHRGLPLLLHLHLQGPAGRGAVALLTLPCRCRMRASFSTPWCTALAAALPSLAIEPVLGSAICVAAAQ